MPHVVVAPDKFRGSASASEVAAAMGEAARSLGWSADEAPVSDGGEGFCEVLKGRAHRLQVHDPLGVVVQSAWYELDGGVAAIEMAMASGLDLVGGMSNNDPVRADTVGTGELIAAAVKSGYRRILVGVGGSATTDGGWGALEVLEPHSRLSGVRIEVACDVKTRFVDAAATFSPQKGATPAQVELLTRRLERLAQIYRERFRVDVAEMDGSGAAGGLAGGLAAIGATLVSGFDLVAERIELAERIEGADLVLTGEGLLDEQTFNGKSVGGVVALAGELAVPVAIVAGDAEGSPGKARTLVDAFGPDRSWDDPLGCVRDLTIDLMSRLAAS